MGPYKGTENWMGVFSGLHTVSENSFIPSTWWSRLRDSRCKLKRSCSSSCWVSLAMIKQNQVMLNVLGLYLGIDPRVAFFSLLVEIRFLGISSFHITAWTRKVCVSVFKVLLVDRLKYVWAWRRLLRGVLECPALSLWDAVYSSSLCCVFQILYSRLTEMMSVI